MTVDDQTPAEVLDELDELDAAAHRVAARLVDRPDLALDLHERDLSGLPGAARRLLDRALGIEPPNIFPPPTEGPTP